MRHCTLHRNTTSTSVCVFSYFQVRLVLVLVLGVLPTSVSSHKSILNTQFSQFAAPASDSVFILCPVNKRRSVDLSVDQFISLSVHQSISLSVHQSISSSVDQFISSSVDQFISRSVHQFISSSVHQSIVGVERCKDLKM